MLNIAKAIKIAHTWFYQLSGAIRYASLYYYIMLRTAKCDFDNLAFNSFYGMETPRTLHQRYLNKLWVHLFRITIIYICILNT